MKRRCVHCGELVEAERMRAHVIELGCIAAARTLFLLREGLRPVPAETHTLPPWCVEAYDRHLTRGKYEGEPRADVGLLAEPVLQLWVPRWMDIIVDLWSGPISMQGEARAIQRDNVLHIVKLMWTSSMKQQIVDAYREDLRAVRELLRPIIVGTPPMLIVEFEAMGRRG